MANTGNIWQCGATGKTRPNRGLGLVMTATRNNTNITNYFTTYKKEHFK